MAKRNKYDYQETFNRYEKVETLEFAKIIHIYPQKATYEGCGFNDSKYIKVKLFNTDTRQMLETSGDSYHDGLCLRDVVVSNVRAFADGSTMIKLSGNYKFQLNQEITFFNKVN